MQYYSSGLSKQRQRIGSYGERGVFREDNAAAPRASFVDGWCRRIQDPQAMRRNDRLDIIRGQNSSAAIVIVAIACIKRDLEIINHDNRIRASTEHDLKFFGEWKIVVPMRI